MKVEIEVKSLGTVDVEGTADAFKSTELIYMYELSKDTTLGQLESYIKSLFDEAETSYSNPEQCLAKITIRAKKENGEIKYLG